MMKITKIPVLISLSMPPVTPAMAQSDFAPMALNSFTILPSPFPYARVMGQDGSVMGNIQGVQRGPNGVPTSIRIGVAGGKIITLRATEASYEQGGNVVIADMRAASEAKP